MTDIVERLRGIYRIPIADGLGKVEGNLEPDNEKEFVRQFASPPIQIEAADEIERLRSGIKRLSDEEELCAETTGDDPFSLVYLAAKLADAETRIADLISERDNRMTGELDEPEACHVCCEALQLGDPVYYSEDGYMHDHCTGPERESFYNADERPLSEGEPVPRPLIWNGESGKGMQLASDARNDDACVDRFSRIMSAKLAAARVKGRNGWDNQAECSLDDLSQMLHAHVLKGDPVDVANFAMMIHQRGGQILPVGQTTGDPVGEIVVASTPAAEIIYGRDVKFFERLRNLPIGTKLYAAPARMPVPELNNEQKEITLLRIIESMGGETDSSESRHSWLNWFCSDEIHNMQEDTFNRCNDKGWLNTTHDTSFDTSTTTLTKAGRDALAASETCNANS